MRRIQIYMASDGLSLSKNESGRAKKKSNFGITVELTDVYRKKTHIMNGVLHIHRLKRCCVRE